MVLKRPDFYQLRSLFSINKESVIDSIKTFLFVIVGSIVIFPIVSKLPLFGWDWHYFFNAYNPDYNIYSKSSAYPPYAKYIIQLICWMDWRASLSLLNSITILTISIAVWKNGGKYIDIFLALTTPSLWFLMWIGHPDGLVLLGLITGLPPLILMKPILSPFYLLGNRKLFAWSALFIMVTLVCWPGWIYSLRQATIVHETAMGWGKLGWPILVVGVGLILGAGKDPYRLMAAGCFVTPYLMPYHMAILAPVFGKIQGKYKILLWISSWSVFLGTGLEKSGHYISFIFPLCAFCLSGTFTEYIENIKVNLEWVKRLSRFVSSPRSLPRP